MAAFVSLFRAINVGGKRKVGMEALRAMHTTAGLTSVASLLQTGNVVFESEGGDPAELTARLEKAFEDSFGFHSDVIVRSGAELAALADQNPFLDQPDKLTKWVVVIFLTARPTSEAEQDLLQSYSGPEEIRPTGRELFIYYKEGIGESKLTSTLLERKLKVIGTGRNWNTVVKLVAMTRPGITPEQEA